jgi:hypothetical protein
MIDATAELGRPPLYAMASCRVGNQHLDFEIGWPEFERDTAWAASVLQRAGLGRGDLVLITVTNWESPWASPVIHALRQLGITYATAEVFAWDVRRVLMFLQRFPIKAIIGLSGQTLTALTEAGAPINKLLDKVELVWARPKAAATLAEQGTNVLPYARFGPALAMGLPGQAGALVNAQEWDVAATDDGLLVSNIVERATTFRATPTGFRGTATPIGNEIAVYGEPIQ